MPAHKSVTPCQIQQVPRRLRVEQAPLPTAEEQGLCLGACFTIAVRQRTPYAVHNSQSIHSPTLLKEGLLPLHDHCIYR